VEYFSSEKLTPCPVGSIPLSAHFKSWTGTMDVLLDLWKNQKLKNKGNTANT
jgi:hypothetical protein